MFQIIPEKKIKEAAKLIGDEENTFKKVLIIGKDFKDANLTPMYLLNHITQEIFVTSKERMKNIFH